MYTPNLPLYIPLPPMYILAPLSVYTPLMTPQERRRAARLEVRPLHERGHDFDRAFWRAIPAPQRLAMAWDMVLEYLAWQHPDVDQPRLQRSVCRVERRGR
jgi:hypothetical protein